MQIKPIISQGRLPQPRPDAFFFGYGSLVNRDTHGYRDAQPAVLRGWRRIWRHTGLRDVAYLTVVPDPAGRIEGLIAAVPGADWHALDLREKAYDRTDASHQVEHALAHRPKIAVYAIPEGRHDRPDRPNRLLLSYIDVVAQGYLREFGENGATRFFATTGGWDVPVLDDRRDPRYPRHCRLTGDETAFVNDALAGLGVRPGTV